MYKWEFPCQLASGSDPKRLLGCILLEKTNSPASLSAVNACAGLGEIGDWEPWTSMLSDCSLLDSDVVVKRNFEIQKNVGLPKATFGDPPLLNMVQVRAGVRRCSFAQSRRIDFGFHMLQAFQLDETRRRRVF